MTQTWQARSAVELDLIGVDEVVDEAGEVRSAR
jgi:hypothetical protein